MFCPGCGNQFIDNRRFCNVCGVNLHNVQQVISTNLPITAISDNKNRQRKVKTLGVMLLIFAPFWAALMGIMGDIVRQFSWNLGRFIENCAAFCVVFMMLGVMTLIYSKMMYKKGASSEDTTNNPGLNNYSQANYMPMPQPEQSYLPQGSPLFQNWEPPTRTLEPQPMQMPINNAPINQIPMSQVSSMPINAPLNSAYDPYNTNLSTKESTTNKLVMPNQSSMPYPERAK